MSVGSELTLFMRGIVEGRMLMGRAKNAMQGGIVREGKHNKPPNAYLGKVNEAVRGAFHGPGYIRGVTLGASGLGIV